MIVYFGNMMMFISFYICYWSCDKGWVIWVKGIISFSMSKFYSMEFKDKIINKFLDFWFCECIVSEVMFCKDIKDNRNMFKWCCSIIDNMIYSYESNIYLLNGFFSVYGWFMNIYVVKVIKFYNFIKSLVLKVDFFMKMNWFFINII